MQYNTVVCNTGIVVLILGCCLPHLFTDNPLLAVWEWTLILVGMIAVDTKDQLHRRDRTLKLSTRVRLHGAQCTYLGRPFVINGLDWSCKWNVILLIIKTKGIGFVPACTSYLYLISGYFPDMNNVIYSQLKWSITNSEMEQTHSVDISRWILHDQLIYSIAQNFLWTFSLKYNLVSDSGFTL